MEIKESMNAIKRIEDRYGIMMFRMSLSHLVDVGIRHLTAENVDDTIQKIIAESKEEGAGGTPILTPECQIQIVRCAAELAKFSAWDLFRYIGRQLHDEEERVM